METHTMFEEIIVNWCYTWST